MSQTTPYRPPAARVSDPEERQRPKPPSVRRAVTCLWLAVAFTAVLAALEFVGVVPSENLAIDLATNLVSAAILGFVALKLDAGRGWVRWAFLVLYVLGTLIFAVSVALAPQLFLALPALVQSSALLQFALQTTALVLMFTRASREWFRAPHALAAAGAH